MDEEMKKTIAFNELRDSGSFIPPSDSIELWNRVIDVETFFNEFTKETGLSNLDADDLHLVRQCFTVFKESQSFEELTGHTLDEAKIILIHTAYNTLTTSNSYKAKKLDTLVSKIVKLDTKENEKRFGLFKRGDEK